MIKTILNFFKLGVTVEEKGTKCALPSCNVYTKHRGGYCCVEHKLLHKEMHKKGDK